MALYNECSDDTSLTDQGIADIATGMIQGPIKILTNAFDDAGSREVVTQSEAIGSLLTGVVVGEIHGSWWARKRQSAGKKRILSIIG